MESDPIDFLVCCFAESMNVYNTRASIFCLIFKKQTQPLDWVWIQLYWLNLKFTMTQNLKSIS